MQTNFLRRKPQSSRRFLRSVWTRENYPLLAAIFILCSKIISNWIIYKESAGTTISCGEFILGLMEEMRIGAFCNKCPQLIDPVQTLKLKKYAFQRCKEQNKTSSSSEGCQKLICGKCVAGMAGQQICSKLLRRPSSWGVQRCSIREPPDPHDPQGTQTPAPLPFDRQTDWSWG